MLRVFCTIFLYYLCSSLFWELRDKFDPKASELSYNFNISNVGY